MRLFGKFCFLSPSCRLRVDFKRNFQVLVLSNTIHGQIAGHFLIILKLHRFIAIRMKKNYPNLETSGQFSINLTLSGLFAISPKIHYTYWEINGHIPISLTLCMLFVVCLKNIRLSGKWDTIFQLELLFANALDS